MDTPPRDALRCAGAQKAYGKEKFAEFKKKNSNGEPSASNARFHAICGLQRPDPDRAAVLPRWVRVSGSEDHMRMNCRRQRHDYKALTQCVRT